MSERVKGLHLLLFQVWQHDSAINEDHEWLKSFMGAPGRLYH
jgi:hypothetical protein